MSNQFPTKRRGGRLKRFTKIDIAIYKFLREYWGEYLKAPTLRDVQNQLELSSVSVVNYSYLKLAEAGLIGLEGEYSQRRPYLVGSQLEFTPPPSNMCPKLGELVSPS